VAAFPELYIRLPGGIFAAFTASSTRVIFFMDLPL